jgi:hypothetical protein
MSAARIGIGRHGSGAKRDKSRRRNFAKMSHLFLLEPVMGVEFEMRTYACRYCSVYGFRGPRS